MIYLRFEPSYRMLRLMVSKTSPEELIKGFGKIRVKAEEKPVK